VRNWSGGIINLFKCVNGLTYGAAKEDDEWPNLKWLEAGEEIQGKYNPAKQVYRHGFMSPASRL